MKKTFTHVGQAARYIVESYPRTFSEYGNKKFWQEEDWFAVLDEAEELGISEPDGENEVEATAGKWTVLMPSPDVTQGYSN